MEASDDQLDGLLSELSVNKTVDGTSVNDVEMTPSSDVVSPGVQVQNFGLVWVDVGSRMCRQAYGSGTHVCVKLDCDTTHRKAVSIDPPGNYFLVQKSPGVAYREPLILGAQLSDSLRNEMLLLRSTHREWLSFASAIESVRTDKGPSGIIEKTDIMDCLQLKVSQEESESPIKRLSRSIDEVHDTMNDGGFNTPYKRSRQRLYPNETSGDTNERLDVLETGLGAVEVGLETVTDNLDKQSTTYNQMFQAVKDGIKTTSDDVISLRASMGTQGSNFMSKVSAPTLWGTLAAVTDHFESAIGDLATRGDGLTVDTIKAIVDNAKAEIFQKVDDHLLKSSQVLGILHNKVKQLEATPPRQQQQYTPPLAPDPSALSISNLESRLQRMEAQLHTALANSDATMKTFGGVSVRTVEEMGAWLQSNGVGNRYDLLVDFNYAMAYVWDQLQDKDTLAKLNTANKLQLDSGLTGTVLESLKGKSPVLFASKNLGLLSVRESYFEKIKSWDEWDDRSTGMKLRIGDLLNVFKSDLSDTIASECVGSREMRLLADSALVETDAFIKDLFAYMEDTYKEYIRASFSDQKAWHITTLLTKKIILHVNEDRIGLLSRVNTTNPAQTAKHVTWVIFQTLVNMSEARQMKFANLPIVASELVKFISHNSPMDTVQVLKESNATLVQDVKSIQKALAGLRSSIDTCNNKHDVLLKQVNGNQGPKKNARKPKKDDDSAEPKET